MKFKFILLALLLLFTVTFLKAQTNDTKKPVITLIAPAEGNMLQIGQAIHFDMDLDDDVMLKFYKVEIHENTDGHVHSANETKRYPAIFDQTWDISGHKHRQIHHHGIVIPANAKEGSYHFVVYCIDAAGNESSVVRNVILSSTRGTHYHH